MNHCLARAIDNADPVQKRIFGQSFRAILDCFLQPLRRSQVAVGNVAKIVVRSVIALAPQTSFGGTLIFDYLAHLRHGLVMGNGRLPIGKRRRNLGAQPNLISLSLFERLEFGNDWGQCVHG